MLTPAEASFRREIAINGTEKDFCSLLRAADDATRKHVADALILLADHGNT
jgi:hypothetical protein